MDMKTITVHILDKSSSASQSETILVSDKNTPATKERIAQRKQEIFDNVPFHKWYFEVEINDELSSEELAILADLELSED